MRLRPDRALITTLAVVVLDQWSKWIAFGSLSAGETVDVAPGLKFGHTENTGIAFGMFSEHPWLVFALMSIALSTLIWFYVRHRKRPGLWLATGLLMGGAIGNAIDRLTLGYVRDFIELPHFPSFNVADMAITFGVIILVLTVEQTSDRQEGASSSDD